MKKSNRNRHMWNIQCVKWLYIFIFIFKLGYTSLSIWISQNSVELFMIFYLLEHYHWKLILFGSHFNWTFFHSISTVFTDYFIFAFHYYRSFSSKHLCTMCMYNWCNFLLEFFSHFFSTILYIFHINTGKKCLHAHAYSHTICTLHLMAHYFLT